MKVILVCFFFMALIRTTESRWVWEPNSPSQREDVPYDRPDALFKRACALGDEYCQGDSECCSGTCKDDELCEDEP